MSDLQIDEAGIYTIAFKRVLIKLHPIVNALLSAYLAQRRTLSPVDHLEDNDHLFPGWLATSHLSKASITNFLRKYKVTGRQLFATALHQFFLSGTRQPKVLVEALGVSLPTAIKYWKLVQPQLVAELEANPPR